MVHDCRNAINSGSPNYYTDESGNGNTLDVYSGAADATAGLRFSKGADVRVTTWDVPAFFIPSGQERGGRMLDGDLFMGYDGWGRLYWGYDDSGTIHLYSQTALSGVSKKQVNHVAVTHQWGTAGSTELFVNGILVPGEWVRGTGAADPSLGTITSTVTMGVDDYLVQLSVNSAAKANADIEDYVKGRL